jgi:hypothetical protein
MGGSVCNCPCQPDCNMSRRFADLAISTVELEFVSVNGVIESGAAAGLPKNFPGLKTRPLSAAWRLTRNLLSISLRNNINFLLYAPVAAVVPINESRQGDMVVMPFRQPELPIPAYIQSGAY